VTPADLRVWQSKMGYASQTQAAYALGMSESGYKNLIGGKERRTGKTIEQLDRRTALACAALAQGLGEWKQG
jgi:hypothetical protein